MSTSYTIRRYLEAPEPQDVVLYSRDAIGTSSVVSFSSDIASTISPDSSVSAHSRSLPKLRRKQGHRKSEDERYHTCLQSSSARHKTDTIGHQGRPRRVYLVAPSVTSSISGAGLSIASKSMVKSSASTSSSLSSSSSSTLTHASESTIKPSSRVTIISTKSHSRTSSGSSTTFSHSSASTQSSTTQSSNTQHNNKLQLRPNSIVLTLPHDEARLAAYMTYLVRVKNVDPAAATAYLATRRDCTAAACHLEIMAAADDSDGARVALFVNELLRKHGAVCRRVIWRRHRRDEELEHWLDDLRADRKNWPKARREGMV